MSTIVKTAADSAEPPAREAGPAAEVDRQEHQARRGSATADRAGPLYRRHRPSQHAARGGAAQHAGARPHQVDRHRRRGGTAGVVKVLTGADIARATGPLPCFSNPPVEQRCVAVGRVRHVGEAVAVVVAKSRYIAEDALDLIAVDYEGLPVMVDPEQAVKATGDGVLHPERGPTNVAMQRRFAFGPVDADFSGAAKIVRRKLRWPRSGAQPLETVGASPSTRAAQASSPFT